MSNDPKQALVPVESTSPAPRTPLSVIEHIAKHAHVSGAYKRFQNPSGAVMVLLKGQDLGISPTSALESIHFIDGKPTVSGNLMWSLVLGSPEYRKSRIVKKDDKGVTIRWIREIKNPDGSVEKILDIEDSYTEEDAKAAGLLGKDVWKKYKKAMLFNRCVSQGFKMFAAHLGMGGTLYTPDELGAEINADGEAVVFDADFTVVEEKPLNLDELLKDSGTSVEEVARFLGVDLKDLEAPTQDELKRVRQMIEDRKKVRGSASVS
jgi:hypothetical protein